ncbi:hypothetical protein E2C01_029748 [Portunus trituberculatus]|uniref:Uncharacterized protein n=1 Tax=Portunus trituberculatus TaxID=210409 RepID=A0A5B7EVD0_PORTR|nr:hypothetical protein [Portunus trituberculatus]
MCKQEAGRPISPPKRIFGVTTYNLGVMVTCRTRSRKSRGDTRIRKGADVVVTSTPNKTCS